MREPYEHSSPGELLTTVPWTVVSCALKHFVGNAQVAP